MRSECDTWPRAKWETYTLSRRSGIYALYLKSPSLLLGLELRASGLLYIGSGDGCNGLAGRCHFGDRARTINHSPRKSLAVLLMNQLCLSVEAKPGGKWGLDPQSEWKLTDWMRENVQLAIKYCVEPVAREKELIRRLAPPLNLKDCAQSPQHNRIKRLRAEAKANVHRTAHSLAPTRSIPLRPVGGTTCVTDYTTAEELAARYSLNPKSFRARLRRENFAWHRHGEPWRVAQGSKEEDALLKVALAM